MIKSLFTWARERFGRERTPLTVLARFIVIEPSDEQMQMAKKCEAALERVSKALVALADDAFLISTEGVALQIDGELRSIIGKAYAARKRVARDCFVKTSLD